MYFNATSVFIVQAARWLLTCVRCWSVMIRAGQSEEAPREVAPVAAAPQVTVIPGVDSLIGDLLDMDIGPPMTQQYHQSMGPPVGAVPSAGAMDLLGEGLDSLVIICIFYLFVSILTSDVIVCFVCTYFQYFV